MFKPIKDFLTFIQKNSSNTDVGDEVCATEGLNAVNSSVILSHLEEMNSPRVTIEKNGVTATDMNPPPDIDEDDIELQIKSSIMIKKQSPQTTRPPTPTLAYSATSIIKLTQSDHNHNNQPKYSHIVPEEDDELADFKNDPMQNSAEDYCSVGSEIEDLPLHSADEAGDEFATEDEDALEEKSYPELEGDGDLNASISSSNNDDPLAIDITSLATEADMIVNPLDSSTQDEKIKVASNGEIVWYDTTDIENSTVSIHTSDKNPKAASLNSKQPQLDLKKCGAGEESNEETERNDNSDSGLGTETSSLMLQTTIENSITENTGYADDQCGRIFENPSSTSEVDSRKPIVSCRGSENTAVAVTSKNVEPLPVGAIHTLPPTITTNAKSKTTAVRPCTPSARKPLRSNLKRRISDVDTTLDVESASGSRPIEQDAFQPKKQKRSITFDAVQVFYFPRQQGFSCVPSAGGCTLGMGSQHIDSRRLTLAEHAAELRRAHRLQMQEINPRGSSSEDTDESEEDYLSEGSGSDLDADSNGFLQPVAPKQRRTLLKAAGVRKIDTSEKFECRNIRNSREVCGCTCRDFCDPETCTCSRAGIKCQVDRAMFPCGCSRDACGNTSGRVEFNPARVRTHFIHTIMRLDMENRQQQPAQVSYDAATGLMLSHSANNGAANYYNSIQPQSNYSSGYASPAYTTDTTANYMQPQNLLYPNHLHNETTLATNGGNEQYLNSMDSIDGGSIYGTNIAPSYGEILPNYAATPTTMQAPAMSAPYNNNHAQLLNFPTSSYVSYQPQPQQQQEQEHQQHHQQSSSHSIAANYLAQSQQNNGGTESSIMHSAYSSCAVPSRPPYGTATTCSSSSTTSDTNFISLDTPIASSSRLSQINDLLQHNRNTTAALVAVLSSNCPSPAVNSANSSIETPPLNESQKACFVFDTDLAMETVAISKPISRLLSSPPPPLPSQSEPPPIAPATIETLCNFSGGSSSSGCNYPI